MGETMRVFGPVPSRRLGRSVGINNIPPKICTYSCIYCQLGHSLRMTVDRLAFYSPDELYREIEGHLQRAGEHGEPVDYLTLVPDGEPTLDRNLGVLLDLLKPFDIKIAVITNATLIDRPAVRDDLARADWVSIKIDTVDERMWRKIDRPHRKLHLDDITRGMERFAGEFDGRLVTETMLVKGLNDSPEHVRGVAEFIKTLGAATSYLSVPTRPPAEERANPPEESDVNQAYQVFVENGLQAEYLIGYEGNRFAFTGNVEKDILSITSVHPMRADAVETYLKKAGSNKSTVDKLVREGKLVATNYDGRLFFLRKLILPQRGPNE